MKRGILFLLVVSLCRIYGWAQSIEGYWGGELDVQGMKLGLFFDISKSGEDLNAILDVPAQGASGIKVAKTTFDGFNIRMDISSIPAKFEGTLLNGIIGGTFSQNGITLPLILSRKEKMQIKRPQEPKPPFPYRQEEVKFRNEREGITLAGTLTMPEGKERCPAVVLITGSGSQNRDEEMYHHKPFAVIADYLTRNGIAVLRYDDRGVGDSERGKVGATTLDLSYDAEAAVDFLKARNGFTHVGVAGHSEGGMISFMLSERKMVDFVISLAGPSVKGTEILIAQQDSLFRLSGMPQKALDTNMALFKELYSIINSSETVEVARPAIESLTSTLPEEARRELNEQFLVPWMFFFCKYDPAHSIASTTCPVLVLNGTKDMQVIASQNITAYREIISNNPNAKFEIHVLPGLNHLFQHCTTGHTSEYGQIEETISPEVLEIMKTFILTQTTSAGS